MKKQFLLAGAIASLSGAVFAQSSPIWNSYWTGSRWGAYRDGPIGINNSAPNYVLDINTEYSGDGIRIKHDNNTYSDGAWFVMSVINGSAPRTLGLTLGGNGSPVGAGNLGLYDFASPSTPRLFMEGTTGNFAIGNTSPAGRFHVTDNNTSSNAAGTFEMVTNGFNRGLQVEANGGSINWAGVFVGGTSTGVTQNIGVYGATPFGYPANDFAGYFEGNVRVTNNLYVVGTAGCTAMAWTSDRMLKKDIKQITNSLDKIAKLKPSTYNFRTDEFEAAHLPSGAQLGLIAQDLEEVYPELVSEMAEQKNFDPKGNVTGTVPAHKVVNYIGLIPVLIGGMQEQQKLIDELKTANALQQQQIDLLLNKTGTSTGISSTGLVTGFALEQNIPNPFSSETVINYTLPEQVKTASLLVYDLTGKQITSFDLTQKGASSITITSEKLSAGIYIYSVVADGKILDSKRMVVAGK